MVYAVNVHTNAHPWCIPLTSYKDVQRALPNPLLNPFINNSLPTLKKSTKSHIESHGKNLQAPGPRCTGLFFSSDPLPFGRPLHGFLRLAFGQPGGKAFGAADQVLTPSSSSSGETSGTSGEVRRFLQKLLGFTAHGMDMYGICTDNREDLYGPSASIIEMMMYCSYSFFQMVKFYS